MWKRCAPVPHATSNNDAAPGTTRVGDPSDADEQIAQRMRAMTDPWPQATVSFLLEQVISSSSHVSPNDKSIWP